MEDPAQHTSDLATLQKERDEYLAGWKRAQADYANLIKETEKARQSFTDYAKEQCLGRLLPAIDQFEIALQFQPALDVVPEADRRKFETWVTGLRAVQSLWEQAAKEMGLEPTTSTGKLDPSQHEAIAEETHATIPAGDLIRVTQGGWKLNGKLIRPAKVIVSKGQS